MILPIIVISILIIHLLILNSKYNELQRKIRRLSFDEIQKEVDILRLKNKYVELFDYFKLERVTQPERTYLRKKNARNA